MEPEKARLSRTLADQNVPTAFQGGLARLEVELLAGPIEAVQDQDRLARPGIGPDGLHEVAGQPDALEWDLQNLRPPGHQLGGFEESVTRGQSVRPRRIRDRVVIVLGRTVVHAGALEVISRTRAVFLLRRAGE